MNLRKVCGVFLLGFPVFGFSQVIDPFYSGNYSFVDLGPVAGVPANYGGLTTALGDPSTLIIGGAANTSSGNLYSIGVTRDGTGHISGFVGSASVYASAPYNDGGVYFGPGGILFAARWPVNELGEYKTGSVAPDKVVDLAAIGVAGSVSAVNFGPAGYTFANRMKIVSYGGGQFYDATYSPDGSGTYDVTAATLTATLTGGPEGFAYVPLGSVLFGGQNMILSEYGAGNVATYQLDANGDPIVASRRTFMSGLSGAEGAYIDPVTGDFLFSTFGGGSHVIRVSGFAVPEPATFLALAAGALLIAAKRRRR